MSIRIVMMSFLVVGLLLLGSCGGSGVRVGEVEHKDAVIEQIVSALKDSDKEALTSLFSTKALEEADSFENDVDYLFGLIQSEIDSWGKRDASSSGGSIEYGKKSIMLRYSFDLIKNSETYLFYIIDYYPDTIDPDNEGVYMLECRLPGSPNTGSWQERMRAGIYIH